MNKTKSRFVYRDYRKGSRKFKKQMKRQVYMLVRLSPVSTPMVDDPLPMKWVDSGPRRLW